MHRFEPQMRSKSTLKWLFAGALTLVILLGCTLELTSFSRHTTERQRAVLEDAITHCITYCYSIEGVYPESLEYLKEEYGLVYNEQLFYVDYRLHGANLMPDITIIERTDAYELTE